jgi:predicted TIM-barrel fold metal-dependent hydrolase
MQARTGFCYSLSQGCILHLLPVPSTYFQAVDLMSGGEACVRVDAHLHIWDSSEDEHRFAAGKEPPASLANNCTAEALLAQMDAAGIGVSLVVQPINYMFDHSYVATCIRKYPTRLMGMGLLNPALQPSDAVAQLEQLTADGFSSFRFNPYIWPSGESIANPTGRALYQRAGELHCPIGVMAFKGLLLHADQMEELMQLSPQTQCIVDHFGFFRQPPNREGVVDEDAFQRLLDMGAQYSQLHVKVSALFRASGSAAPYQDLRPRLESLLAAFGADRLIYGSDFPFVLGECGFKESADIVEGFLSDLDGSARANIMGGNAMRLFAPKGRSLAPALSSTNEPQ